MYKVEEELTKKNEGEPKKVDEFDVEGGEVGSGRVNNLSNLTGRVRSRQEVMKSSRVESGHDPRQQETGHLRVGPA